MIDTESRLSALIPRLESAEWIALDTEADSLHAYPEKICLLQVSLPGYDAIIDPLAALDLAPVLDVLKDRELILHGADYDLRLLWKSFQFRPRAVFDTMWAARLLGYSEFGLTHLVGEVLSITLEKGPQKMNWARRPLTERMERYARNDTRYLQPLAEALTGRLATLGRLEWQREVCARMVQECSQNRIQDPDLVWRVRGSDRLDRKGLAVLRELWSWREREAKERNKPPYFIVSHETLVALAASASEGQFMKERLVAALPAPSRAELLAAWDRGLRVPPSAQPKLRVNSGRRLTKAEQSRFEELKKQRDHRAAELKMDPSLIASRATLVALASDWERHQTELMFWQRDLLQSPC